MGANATVTICHSRTKDIAAEVKRADIVIAALGKAKFVKGEWLKPGAVVIDVGINQIDDPTTKTGKRLVGDCDYASCQKVAGKITPVPGGVGPMTIAMLLNNTLRLAQRSCGRRSPPPEAPAHANTVKSHQKRRPFSGGSVGSSG